MLEEFEGHLDDSKKKCTESEGKAKAANKLLGQVKNGVEHLTEKMQHIKAVSKQLSSCLQVHVNNNKNNRLSTVQTFSVIYMSH